MRHVESIMGLTAPQYPNTPQPVQQPVMNPYQMQYQQPPAFAQTLGSVPGVMPTAPMSTNDAVLNYFMQNVLGGHA